MFRIGDTNHFFTDGKLTVLMDGGAGSSGKGKIGSFITHFSDSYQFACNAFWPQAGHTVVLDDGRKFFYQTLNSCAYNDNFEKIYIGPGAVVELPALLRELEENNLNENKVGISPLAAILSDNDAKFERGLVDFDGNPIKEFHDGTMKHGSTAHGAGSCTAHKVLRHKNVILARDVEVLRPFLCDVSEEILGRLNNGQAGLLEIAQGFQLSLNYNFYPYCTGRNCTVAQGISDMFLPPWVVGDVILNFRTYPIRINNKKFIGIDGKHLTWDEVQSGVPHVVYEGNSGPGYDDSEETTWEQVTEDSGSPNPIFEITSVTKLPRRVFTFSKKNVEESIKYNDPSNSYNSNCTKVTVNFANYVDYQMLGVSGIDTFVDNLLTDKMVNWIDDNLDSSVDLALLGTGPKLSDMIIM